MNSSIIPKSTQITLLGLILFVIWIGSGCTTSTETVAIDPTPTLTLETEPRATTAVTSTPKATPTATVLSSPTPIPLERPQRACLRGCHLSLNPRPDAPDPRGPWEGNPPRDARSPYGLHGPHSWIGSSHDDPHSEPPVRLASGGADR